MSAAEQAKLQPAAEPRRAFDPDLIATMQTSLDAAWNVLRCNDSPLAVNENRNDTRTMLARRILDRVQAGETNYGRLLMVALDGLIQTGDGLTGEHRGTAL